jgi:hypothetical protein
LAALILKSSEYPLTTDDETGKLNHWNLKEETAGAKAADVYRKNGTGSRRESSGCLR